MISIFQCRMARAALGWSAAELARRAQVGIATVNRFENLQGEGGGSTPAIIAAMQRALESAGAIFEENGDGLGGVKMRRKREGDLVRLRPQSRLQPNLKNKVGKIFQVEPHPPRTGPTYRVSVEFPDGEHVDGVFEFEFELVKAAPESSSMALADFQVLREENEFEGVIIHCFDNQKLVLALIPRQNLEDYFHLPGITDKRRLTIAEWSSVVEVNRRAFERIIGDKYARGEYRMLNRYNSTHPFIETTLTDIQVSNEKLTLPSTQLLWQRA
jgi:transcriptional regulator with XRE-family HTH domain